MNGTLKTYNTIKKYPFGKRIFSWVVCRKAPYFGTIKPLFLELEQGRCVLKMRKRKSVTNHLGTVHAIAMCNMVELAGGIGMDVSIADNLRWIPSGMTVEYLALAKTDLTGIFQADMKKLTTWDISKPFPAEVNCYDTSGKAVMRGIIQIHLSEKKKK